MKRDLLNVPLGDNPLNLWVRRKQLDAHTEKVIAEVSRQVDEPPPGRGRLPGDARTLRGIPAIGYGVGGTQPGTDPVRETLARERRRARLDLDE